MSTNFLRFFLAYRNQIKSPAKHVVSTEFIFLRKSSKSIANKRRSRQQQQKKKYSTSMMMTNTICWTESKWKFPVNIIWIVFCSLFYYMSSTHINLCYSCVNNTLSAVFFYLEIYYDPSLVFKRFSFLSEIFRPKFSLKFFCDVNKLVTREYRQNN